MKIVYNPKDGAPITRYIYLGTLIDPHYPDGYDLEKGKANGLIQYDDELADAICETYKFLEVISSKTAKAIIDRPPAPELACDFPECDFKTTYQVALGGHKRKHKDENPEEPAFDPEKIPVAGGKRVSPTGQASSLNDPELKAGVDGDGVTWYGDGAVREKSGFGTVPAAGKGHFLG